MPLTPRTEAHASNITINSQAAGTPITTTKPTMPPHTPNSNTGIVNSTNKGIENHNNYFKKYGVVLSVESYWRGDHNV